MSWIKSLNSENIVMNSILDLHVLYLIGVKVIFYQRIPRDFMEKSFWVYVLALGKTL